MRAGKRGGRMRMHPSRTARASMAAGATTAIPGAARPSSFAGTAGTPAASAASTRHSGSVLPECRGGLSGPSGRSPETPMLKKILFALALLIAGFAAVVAMQPSEFHVERTATVAAPPASVFAHVDDLHKWEAWSPWAKLDPAAKVAYEGVPAGKGAGFTWSGNDKVGEGRMTI